MSKQSEYVKSWRKRSKARIIESMGGSCAICGYNKCVSALALHHLDPNSKDFNLSDALKNAKSWDKIVNELRKCALLCHNCHCEVHEKLINVPEDAPKFNEELFDYKNKEN